jgi:hypothetical protein
MFTRRVGHNDGMAGRAAATAGAALLIVPAVLTVGAAQGGGDAVALQALLDRAGTYVLTF